MNRVLLKMLQEFMCDHMKDPNAWTRVELHAGVEPKAEEHMNPEILDALLEGAAEMIGAQDVGGVWEACGRYYAPRLLERLQVESPEAENWNCLDVVERLPELLHGLNPDEPSPLIETRSLRLRMGEAALVILNPHRICQLVRGILMGVAEVREEPLVMEEHLCQWQGSILCRFSLTLNDPLILRAVDVRREFELVQQMGERLRFYNRFQGVPVVSEGELTSFDQDEVTIRLPQEQLLAMQGEEQTFLSISHLNCGLMARVESIRFDEGTVTLTGLEVTDGAVGMRLSDRVEPPFPVIVECGLGDFVLRGQLMDISTGGLSMVVRRDADIGKEDLFSPVEMNFKLQSTPPTSRRSGEKLKYSIRWMEGDGDEPVEVTVMGNLLDLHEDNDLKSVRVVFSSPPEEVLGLIQTFVEQRRQVVMQALAKS